MQMHCGTFMSRAFAIAAESSFMAPSMVSFSDAAVSGMGFVLSVSPSYRTLRTD
jgi:hypothetical protein